MHFKDMDIEQLLRNEFAALLGQPMTFNTLKRYLVDLKPIDVVDERMKKVVLDAENEELKKEPVMAAEDLEKKSELLKKERDALLLKASGLNHSIFVEQLNALPKLPFKNANEENAFRSILKQMDEYFNQGKVSEGLFEKIHNTKILKNQLEDQLVAVIKKDKRILSELNAVFNSLNNKNTTLEKLNRSLEKEAKNLSGEMMECEETLDALGEPLFVISLILALLGLALMILPLIMVAPPIALMTVLLSICVGALAIEIGLAIPFFIDLAASFYISCCMMENYSKFSENSDQIEKNAGLMDDAESKTVVALNQKLNGLDKMLEGMNKSLEESLAQEYQLLETAKSIESKPASVANLSMFRIEIRMDQLNTPPANEEISPSDDNQNNFK